MTVINRTRLLFYCQSLLGIGHLTASLQVISELLEHSDIDLVYGGHEIDIHLKHPGFRFLSLPAILIDDSSGNLYDPNNQCSIEQLWLLRAEKIRSFLYKHYDGAIVEFFPFGRRKFKKEIHQLFEQLQDQNSTIPIFSFVREVLVPETTDAEQRMVDSINKYIHTVFVRGDPNVIRFEDTFSLTNKIEDKIFYLGYLGSTLPATLPPRTKQILVSQGGGSIGLELLKATIKTAPLLPEYNFLIATGSKTTTKDFASLTNLITSGNVKIVPFLQEFKQHLLTSALSISLGGDNTLADVISTNTPGLAFAYPGNSEQLTRISKLAERGFISPLTANDLKPESLREKIQQAINHPFPQIKIAMNGALKMSEQIKAIISK